MPSRVRKTTARERELRDTFEAIAKERELYWETSVYGDADCTNWPGTVEGLMHEIAHLFELRITKSKTFGSGGIARRHSTRRFGTMLSRPSGGNITPEGADLREVRACAIEVLALRALDIPIDIQALAETSAHGMNTYARFDSKDCARLRSDIVREMKTPRSRKIADEVVALVLQTAISLEAKAHHEKQP